MRSLLGRLDNQQLAEQGGRPEHTPGQQRASERGEGGASPTASEAEAIELLSESVAAAKEAFDHFTSEYAPDMRSEGQRRELLDSGQVSLRNSLRPTSAPAETSNGVDTPRPSSPTTSAPQGVQLDEEAPLPENLDGFITRHHKNARDCAEPKLNKLKSAEESLSKAIRYSEMRERVYGTRFTNRVHLQEELADIFSKQCKWAEAIKQVQELLREGGTLDDTSDRLARMRQEQLLASIYFGRHQKNVEDLNRHQNVEASRLQSDSHDLKKACTHANSASKERDKLLKLQEGLSVPEIERVRRSDCIHLLAKIFDARGMTVEAQWTRDSLQGSPSQSSSDSVHRPSEATTRATNEYDMVENRQELLLDAIRTNDRRQIQELVLADDFDIERLSNAEKTALLLNAVEREDETALHKLLGPTHGADVDARGRTGATALSKAASRGSPQMIQCLSKYGPNVDSRDKAGETAVLTAVKAGHVACVRLFSVLGASFGLKYEDDETLLHYAVRLKDTKMTTLLLDVAPQIRTGVDNRGMTALHHCAEQGFIAQCEALVRHSDPVEVNMEDSAGRTALYFAAARPSKNCSKGLIDLLLKHGANIEMGLRHERFKEYAALRKVPSHGSVSTRGTTGTVSSSASTFRSIFSRQK
ncbi:hypothetical protein B0A50_01860 [Salinomyces thailandicus]|uniref:Uncharacterized protein n=1 Tax=Salinomyces thailandicus TaxID=706561 RepID=A0A4U0U8Y4_9PEZI|nr:hypothetical protein B0A50_01860 [Salinomyces thailandica]